MEPVDVEDLDRHASCADQVEFAELGQRPDHCLSRESDPFRQLLLRQWEADLHREIVRAGQRIIAFHVSDWLADTSDVRLDRGMPGDGLIDLPSIRGWVEAAGYRGPIEVEIFSKRDWWTRDPDVVVRTILER